jgi:sulfur carrier protein
MLSGWEGGGGKLYCNPMATHYQPAKPLSSKLSGFRSLGSRFVAADSFGNSASDGIEHGGYTFGSRTLIFHFLLSQMIRIEFNGAPKEIDEGSTVLDLLTHVKIESRFCAVELNFDIVPKSDYASRLLQTGDKVEVVTLVGGG